ncbi:MAG: type I methionyl aminopeptidase, partial [Candidatus Paceibacterota bacterium]
MRLKTKEDIKKIKESGKILVSILHKLRNISAPGVELSSLDKKAKEILSKHGAKSAFYGYRPSGASDPYPAYICTSVNDQIVHGTPTHYKLKEGDLLTIDIGVNKDGFIADAAFTFGIGNISKEAVRLLNSTNLALERAISVMRPGNTLGDVGYEIETQIKKDKLKLINGLTGHGVGFELHENPTVFNYGDKGTGMKLQEGMVLAIEPMVSTSSEDIIQDSDESFCTDDG